MKTGTNAVDRIILDAAERGQTNREIATLVSLRMGEVKRILDRPKIMEALLQHRVKLARESFGCATMANKILKRQLQRLDKKLRDDPTLCLDSRELRDLAWVNKSTFEQAGELLKQAGVDDSLDPDGEIKSAAKRLAAKKIREEADKPPIKEVNGHVVEATA